MSIKKIFIFAMITLLLTEHLLIFYSAYCLPSLGEMPLKFIEAYLSPASYPGSANTNLYVVLENSKESNITSASFRIELPEGFIINDPRTSVGIVGAGERFTVRFSGILVPQDTPIGTYSAIIYADFSTRAGGEIQYESTIIYIQFEVTETPREDPIIVSSVSVLYQGSPAPLLPSAKGAIIRITLANRLPEAIGSIIVDPSFPSGFEIRSISGTHVNGMPPGGSCLIDVTIDVDKEFTPGRVSIPLKVSFVRIISGSSFIGEQNIEASVVVESPHTYLPELSLISAYWGSPTPSPIYAGSRYAPLTLRFINNGRYDIVGGIVEASSKYLRSIKGSEALATRLVPGSYSDVTFYFDVNENVSEIPLNVRAKHIFNEFGPHIEVIRDFVLNLPIEKYPAATSYLELLGHGWQNNYNVFPRTENATFQVVIANRAPFSISGITLYLNLPENMSSRGEGTAKAYVDGPVRSLSTFTASFTVTVGDVKPGEYKAELIVDFILQSGGPGVRCNEKFSLDINVNDDSQAVEFISAGWYEGSVGPNTYGAHLFIFVRNNFVDSMRGAVLEINLPRGMVNAADNSTIAKSSPSTISPLSALPQLQAQELGALIGEYLRSYQATQVAQTQTFSRGDILTFSVYLNILDVSLGVHTLMGNLSYIDQWGTKRLVGLMIPVAILGRTGYVDIRLSGSISVRKRFTNTTLTIENNETSPLYDVYLIVSPYQEMPLLIASPSVMHIEKIDAGEKVNVLLTLAYNPFGFMTQTGGATMITYGPVPLLISIVYKDASGTIKRFNNTVTVIVEPFIDLLIRDISAIGKQSSTTISGVIVNLGSATAYRVRAIFNIGNASAWTLIGDIASADEMAFRIEVSEKEEIGTLTIEYYDAFNQQFSKEMAVKVEMQPETPIVPPQERGLGVETWIVVGAVIVFLAIAFVLIYRVLRARSVNKVEPE
ncbi:MAG: hypothetical protein QXX56_00160 [Candidatus Bathyarchaeia archaeon]